MFHRDRRHGNFADLDSVWPHHAGTTQDERILAVNGARRRGTDSPRGRGSPACAGLRRQNSTVGVWIGAHSPVAVDGQDTLVLGKFLRDVAKLNQDQRNFRVFGPDETLVESSGGRF